MNPAPDTATWPPLSRPYLPSTIVRAGHEVLDEVAAFVARFSVFPSEHCAPTLALWHAHTHATEQFNERSPSKHDPSATD